VIPVKKALQGHLESPRLWDKYISKMITEELVFQSTVHEPCLYYKRDKDDNLTLILRQVDDFQVANKDSKECDRIGELIQARMTNPLNQLGTIRKFNGVNVEQTRACSVRMWVFDNVSIEVRVLHVLLCLQRGTSR
jgi:hypothetical protein